MPSLRPEPIEIAIIGGGIVGLVLAVGLLRRGIQVTVYEQAHGFREIGAGIAFTANAIQCMEQLDPAIVTALRSSGSVATSASNGVDKEAHDYLRWIDGYNQLDADDPSYQRMLYQIDAGYRGFEGCRRDQFLEALVKVVPPEAIRCRRRLQWIEESGLDERIGLAFVDGTRVEVDAVIGCDGIKSRVREILFGEGNPVSYPHYTHEVAYRTLIPMEAAIAALGEYKARNQHNHVGPRAHLIHYPVANNTLINATAFVMDREEWLDDKQMVAPASRGELEAAFADWSPCVRNVIRLFPEELEKWACFDLWDYPAPYYSRGKICLAGDAAHASTPHHGAGAGMGVEDALCLSTLIMEVVEAVQKEPTLKGAALKTAFETFGAVRRTRSQWLVNSSRTVRDFYHQVDWGEPAKWVKAETCFEELKDRSHKIWHFDYEAMKEEAVRLYRERMEWSRLGGAITMS
ncbi:FAD binding domain-containing protein [Aspergillus indologenus CBS 114.80]|uniref:FAD binding domain-containing protein n=1 Tax=Aspergillus indologenus CBS 114.80 TaxID=1450541 RepID=A0A2V5I8J9_9EURO|nr:FAD binding domain-containing protein [Aspergillus indologenus CBS 114.80]